VSSEEDTVRKKVISAVFAVALNEFRDNFFIFIYKATANTADITFFLTVSSSELTNILFYHKYFILFLLFFTLFYHILFFISSINYSYDGKIMITNKKGDLYGKTQRTHKRISFRAL